MTATPQPGQPYQLRPVIRQLPDSVLVLGVVGRRVRFLEPDGHTADLHADVFRGLYEPAEVTARNPQEPT